MFPGLLQNENQIRDLYEIIIDSFHNTPWNCPHWFVGISLLEEYCEKRHTPVGELIGVLSKLRFGVWWWTGVHENGPFGGVSRLPLLPLKLFECVGMNELVSGAKWMYSLPYPFCSVIGSFRFGNSEKFLFKWAASSGLHSDSSSGCRIPKSLHRFTTAPKVFFE